MKRRWKSAWIVMRGAGSGAVVATSAATASAAPPNDDIVLFESPPECLDVTRLAQLVRKNATAAPPAGRRLVGTARRTEAGYRFELFLEEGNQRRGVRRLEVEGTDCHREDEALGLIGAMLLEGPADELPPEPAPSPSPASTASPSSSRTPPNTSRQAPSPPDESWRLGVAASGSLSTGWQPGAAPGVVVAATLQMPLAFELRLPLGYWFPTSVDGPEGGVEIAHVALGLELCRYWRPSDTLRIGPCAGAQAVTARALGRGFPVDERAEAWFAAGALLSRAGLSLGAGWQVAAAAGIELPSGRASFVGVGSSGEELLLFRSASVATRFELGLEWRPD